MDKFKTVSITKEEMCNLAIQEFCSSASLFKITTKYHCLMGTDYKTGFIIMQLTLSRNKFYSPNVK